MFDNFKPPNLGDLGNFRPVPNRPGRKTKERYAPIVDKVNALEQKMSAMSDEQLREQTETSSEKSAREVWMNCYQKRSRRCEGVEESFGLRPFDVQVIGGVILHEGQIAEMRTGEGKSKTRTAYLNALSGKGVHVVTVNDYLAKRDMEWIGQIHKFLGLSVGLIRANMASKGEAGTPRTHASQIRARLRHLRDNLRKFQNLVLKFNFASSMKSIQF